MPAWWHGPWPRKQDDCVRSAPHGDAAEERDAPLREQQQQGREALRRGHAQRVAPQQLEGAPGGGAEAAALDGLPTVPRSTQGGGRGGMGGGEGGANHKTKQKTGTVIEAYCRL